MSAIGAGSEDPNIANTYTQAGHGGAISYLQLSLPSVRACVCVYTRLWSNHNNPFISLSVGPYLILTIDISSWRILPHSCSNFQILSQNWVFSHKSSSTTSVVYTYVFSDVFLYNHYHQSSAIVIVYHKPCNFLSILSGLELRNSSRFAQFLISEIAVKAGV